MILDPHEEIRNNTDFLEVEKQEGNSLYLKGHVVPIQGAATPQEILTANIIKHHLKNFHWKALQKRLFTTELTGFSIELARLICGTIGRAYPDIASQNIAWAIDKDLAYKWRLQDLFTETTAETISRSPFKEIIRLWRINKKRDIYTKSSNALLLIGLSILWPPARNRFKKTIHTIHFPTLQLDDSARYWLSLRKDYHYGQK